MGSDLAILQSELDDLRSRFPALKDDELFVLWFVMAYLNDDPDSAALALVGGSSDKNVDAVYVDHDTDRVAIVQGKYSLSGHGSEKRSDVIAFAELASTLLEDTKFSNWLQGVEPLTREKVKAARRHVTQKGYNLNLYYVTTRSCSAPLRDEAIRTAKSTHSRLAILTRIQVSALLRDYLDGVAPPVPTVRLPIETSPSSGIIKRYDPRTKITSWVFSARAQDVGQLFTSHQAKIFARNIRGYLGAGDEHSVNAAIRQTLKKDPEHFWYFNNGVTIACDGAQQIDTGGSLVLHMDNPQIINGQQTTRTLAQATSLKGASVLVRVVALPNSQLDLVDEIVKATNRQNAIRPSDLMSNDRLQVFLGRKLRLRGYTYIRKRGQKSEARAASGGRARFQVTKEELAQAVAACEFEPEIVRSARESLFDESLYQHVFPKKSIEYYLTRLWLMKSVSKGAWGHGPERQYMKYFVAHALWDRLGQAISNESAAFIRASERGHRAAASEALFKSIEATFRAVERFFTQTRKEDGQVLEVYAFFKRRGKYDTYLRFLKRPEQGNLRSRIRKADKTFLAFLGTEDS